MGRRFLLGPVTREFLWFLGRNETDMSYTIVLRVCGKVQHHTGSTQHRVNTEEQWQALGSRAVAYLFWMAVSGGEQSKI